MTAETKRSVPCNASYYDHGTQVAGGTDRVDEEGRAGGGCSCTRARVTIAMARSTFAVEEHVEAAVAGGDGRLTGTTSFGRRPMHACACASASASSLAQTMLA
jgi:hypothetical protein